MSAVSAIVQALVDLNSEEREIFEARYCCSESIEQTCIRLGIDKKRYDDLLSESLRRVRRMPASSVALLQTV